MPSWPSSNPSRSWPGGNSWPEGFAWPRAYLPRSSEPGVVFNLDMSDEDGNVLTEAGVADASDFNAGTWTKTAVTVTTDAFGVYDELVATAVTATTSQVPNNHSTGSMTVTATADVIRAADDWVCVELFATGRAWFNLNTGTVGTTSNVTASISPLGGGAFRLRVTSVFGANYVMLRHAAADNNPNCLVGHSFFASNVTISQTRLVTFRNLVSGVTITQATANLQPRFNPTGFNGLPCIEPGGQQDFTGTEAAVVAALQNNADHTLYVVLRDLGGSNGTVFSAGNSGVATNRTKSWGRGATNFFRYETRSDAGAIVTSTNTTGAYSAGSHIVVWRSTGGVVDQRVDLAAQTVDVPANSPNPLTVNQFGVLGRADSATDNRCSGGVAEIILANVAHSNASVSNIENYLRAKWLTP